MNSSALQKYVCIQKVNAVSFTFSSSHIPHTNSFCLFQVSFKSPFSASTGIYLCTKRHIFIANKCLKLAFIYTAYEYTILVQIIKHYHTQSQTLPPLVTTFIILAYVLPDLFQTFPFIYLYMYPYTIFLWIYFYIIGTKLNTLF